MKLSQKGQKDNSSPNSEKTSSEKRNHSIVGGDVDISSWLPI